MKILIAYFSQTGNTEKIARAIYDEAAAHGHEVDLKSVDDTTPVSFNSYDIVFLGSACHDADLAEPVLMMLDSIEGSPTFKMAGFVTHSTVKPTGSERDQELYDRWAGLCVGSFERTSLEKKMDLVGYFHCQGVPSPPIEEFIHREIIQDDKEWGEYLSEVKKHPDDVDLMNAREFTRSVLTKIDS